MTTFLNTITDGIREIMALFARSHESVKSLWELRSEYRRLKQMHAGDAYQMFSNSRMLPLSKTFTRDETTCRDFWRHKRSGTSFDCCTLHRSRKQFLLDIMRSKYQMRTANPSITAVNTVGLEPKSEAQKRKERRAMMDKIFDSSSTAKGRPVSGKEFYRSDMASLRYQLYLTQQRIDEMRTRGLKQAS